MEKAVEKPPFGQKFNGNCPIHNCPPKKKHSGWAGFCQYFYMGDTSSNDCFSIVMLVFGVYVLDFRDFFLP